MIDTHCHLDSEEFNHDRDEVIQAAFSDGVLAIIVPATNPSNFESVLGIAQSNSNIFCALGVHPHYANDYNDEVEAEIIRLVNKYPNKIVAIGEIGLDYHYNFAPREVQTKVFARQLEIARQLSLPAIVHNRKSSTDLLELIKSNGEGNKIVLHCFSEDISFLNKSLELGCYVSFTGNVTFKNSFLQDVVSKVPSDKFFLETDSPYMTPVPYRGKRNEPKLINLIANKVSELRSQSLEEVSNMTTKNAISFFNLVLLFLMFFIPNLKCFAKPLEIKQPKHQNASLNFDFTDEPFENDAEFEEENPYSKFISIGSTFGFNTIVVFESWMDENGKSDERNSAYEGKFFWGGNIAFSPFDFMITRLEFIYTKDPHEFWLNNEKYTFTNLYRLVSLSALFIPNPKQRVNYFAGVGFTYMFNSMNLGTDHPSLRQRYGLNGGVGFILNIPIQKLGLFTLTGEWLLLFDFQKDKQIWETELQRFVDAYYYYSLPRFSLNWYPEFLFKLR